MKIDLPALVQLALRFALSIGARQLAASILRKHARDLERAAAKTPGRTDDALAKAAAFLMLLAADVAVGLDLKDVMPALKK